jgi:hypothetical protein
VVVLSKASLIAFVHRADADPALQAQIMAATSPQMILDLAAEADLVISLAELRAASRDLSALYWPWAGRGHAHRRAFFQHSAA